MRGIHYKCRAERGNWRDTVRAAVGGTLKTRHSVRIYRQRDREREGGGWKIDRDRRTVEERSQEAGKLYG